MNASPGSSTSPTVTIGPEDRSLAALTHLSGLAGYIVPLGGVVVPIVIWAVKSDNRIISGIAKQALVLNLIVFLLAIVFGVLALTILLIPISIIGWCVIGLAALVLPIVGAVKASDGVYFRYPGVGIGP